MACLAREGQVRPADPDISRWLEHRQCRRIHLDPKLNDWTEAGARAVGLRCHRGVLTIRERRRHLDPELST
jgi:hypothetical protein